LDERLGMNKQPSNQDLYEVLMELRKELDETYLRIKVFEAEMFPLKRFVYGLISIAGAALVTAMMAVVLK
jgi:hypothetical protein